MFIIEGVYNTRNCKFETLEASAEPCRLFSGKKYYVYE